MKRLRSILSLVAVAATLSFGAAMPASAAGNDKDCLSDQQIQSALEAGQIKSWPRIKKMAGISPDSQEVSDVKVCLIGGIPFYTVNVASPSGEYTKIILNAVDGTI
jgi:uncharacterized membrane protein YkoI